jgi:hypothetical protein
MRLLIVQAVFRCQVSPIMLVSSVMDLLTTARGKIIVSDMFKSCMETSKCVDDIIGITAELLLLSNQQYFAVFLACVVHVQHMFDAHVVVSLFRCIVDEPSRNEYILSWIPFWNDVWKLTSSHFTHNEKLLVELRVYVFMFTFLIRVCREFQYC